MPNTVDTLELFERLKAADLSDKAARELAEAIKRVEQTRLDDAATKADIQAVKTDIQTVRGEIKELEGKTKMYFLVLLFVIILVSPHAVDLIGKLLGVVK